MANEELLNLIDIDLLRAFFDEWMNGEYFNVSLNGTVLTVTDKQGNTNTLDIAAAFPSYRDFLPSGPNAARGLVPSPETTQGNTRFLCENGNWEEIPSSGGSVQIVNNLVDGGATKALSAEMGKTLKGLIDQGGGGTGTVTGVKVGSGSTISPDGNGVVTLPAYEQGAQVNPGVFGGSGDNHSSGLVPDPGATQGTSKYLREDGTWAEPSGSGGVVNNPDEEDLTSVNNLIKFKDRTYDSQSPNGMGMVILRKGTPLASQMTQTNTIYVIKYAFDLNDPNGANPVTIPQNCVLRFEGGSISGGTLVCNNTTIEASPLHIFDNVVLSGTIVGDVMLNHFTHSADCVESRKNLGCAIHVIGECTIDAPMFVESDFSIYGDDMYKTKLMLSSSYSGAVKTVFEFDPANVGVYHTSFRNFSVNGDGLNTDYAFYRHQTDWIPGGPVSIADFENLFIAYLKKGAFYFRCSGFGCTNFININFKGYTFTDPLIDYYGGWFNDNTFERCRLNDVRCGGFVRVRSFDRTYNGVFSAGQITHTNFFNNYFEKMLLKENAKASDNEYYLVNLECQSTIYNVNIENHYIEDIYSDSGAQELEDNPKARLFRIYAYDANKPDPVRVRVVNYKANTTVNNFIALTFSIVNGLSLTNNGQYNTSLTVVGWVKTVYESGNENVIMYSDPGGHTDTDRYSLPIAYSNITNLENTAGALANRLHKEYYYNETLSAGSSVTKQLLPTTIGEKLVFWSDVQITFSYGGVKKIIQGKIIKIHNSANTNAEFVITFQDDQNLVVQQQSSTPATVTLTNNSSSNMFVTIGVICMTFT